MAKKRLFRGVSLVLVLALLMQLLPGSVFAAEDVLTAAAADSRFGEREGEEPSASEEKEGSAVAEEIVSGRGEFQKEFLLENGQHLLAIYPRAVHYAEDGEWKEIDNTLSAVQTSRGDTVYTNAAGLWEVSLPQSLGAGPGVSVSYEGYTLEFSFAGRGTGFSENTSASAVISQPFSGAAAGQIGMESGASVEAADISAGVIQSAGTAYAADERMGQTVPQTADAAIEYASVCEGVDLRYDLISNTLKESLIIESCPEEEEVYIYRMGGEDLELSLEDDGSVLACASDSGEAVFRMPAPYVQDSAGAVSFDVEVTLEESAEGWILAYAAPWDWMAADERVYPVALDPVVHPEITIANTQDQSVFQNKTEPYTWGIIECGRYSGYGISRFYVQYENIPELTSADYITGATMSLYKLQNSTAAAQVNVHKVEGTWDDTTLNWSNKPDYDPTVDDYQVIYSAGWYSWDVTDIVRSWYADGNNGMMFKAADAIENGSSDNWKQFCSSNYGGEVMPVLYMSYINNCGLESCWDYTTQSAGRAGTGYVNSYTGNLVWVTSGLGFSGLRMPVSVSHVYNANDRKNNEFGMGFGWRTNYNQRVYRWENDSSYYIWEDEDGTRHYFKYKSENRYEEETGSGLLLITGRTGDYPYRISDKKGNKSYFDALGRVGVIRNNQETYCNIIVSYVSGSESSSDKYCIAGIRDGAGRFYRFTYTNGLLSRVTFHRNTTDTAVISALDYTFTNSDFTGITYPDGKSVSYSYTSASSHLLKRATDVDGFNVRYAYTSGDPYRVRGVSVYDGSSCGGTLDIVYGQNQTVFTDHNGNAEIMQFNDWGNTVSVQDGQGRAQFSEYDNNEEDDTGKVNQLNLSSKLQNTVGNLVRNSGFEKSGCWTAATGVADTGSWSYATEESWLGSRSLKIVRTANNTFYAVRTPVSSAFTLQPGVTYTFSAYIKTVNMDSSGYGVRLGVKLVGYTGYAKTSPFVKSSPEWTRIEVTYTHPSTSEAELATIHLASYSVGTVYFDCIQVEASATASRYNLVDNGDFTFAGSTEADPYGWSEGDGCRDTEIRTTDASGSAAPQLDSSVYSMTGDAERLKRCYQDVAVSGAAGDVYTLAGWAKGDSVPLTGGTNRRFGLLARFYNADGTESEVLLDFNTAVKSGVGWQYAAKRVVAPKAYTFIRILIVYEANANTAYFDGIQLFREEFGHSYVYDSAGNVTSVTDLRKRTTTYEYTGNDLTKMVLPTGAAQTYTYDSYHNVLTATSPEGVVSTFTYDTYGNNTSVTVGSGSDSVTVSATYSGGNRLSTITDALGNTTTYGYDPYTCVLQYVRRPGETGATQTNYTYDSVYRTTETSQASASCTYEYTDDLLTKLTGGSGTEYGFTCGEFGQVESVKAGTRTLITHTYSNDSNRYLTRSDYGNGDYVAYTYDGYGRITSTGYEDKAAAVEYYYDSSGNLGMRSDKLSGRTTKYFYDLSDRLMKYETTASGYSLVVKWNYDDVNNLAEQSYTLNGTSYRTTYTYDADNRVTKQASGTVSSNYTYDGMSRLAGIVIKNNSTAIVTTDIGYTDTETGTSTQISGWKPVTAGKTWNLTYTYDAKGNILSVTDGTNTTSYEYDTYNQLTRENNQGAGKTWVYAYDSGGNILTKTEYAYTTGAPGAAQNTVAYGYADASWPDLLTSRGGKAVTSDAIGNMLTDGTWTYTWKHGRQLAAMTDGTTSVSYTYDADGMRTGKTVGSTTTKYYYVGARLTDVTYGTNTLHIGYDEFGAESLTYNGTRYYYVKNAQGDVIGLVNGSGAVVAEYAYDAWGNILSISGSGAGTVGAANPIRYRGYVYDAETGFYLTGTRYYDPEIGRFINADSYIQTPNGDMTSTNMFAYCGNNPVNRYDPNGEAFLTATICGIAVWKIAAAFIGTLFVGAATYAVTDSLVKNPPVLPSISLPKIDIKPKSDSKEKDVAPTLPKPPAKDPVHHIVAKVDPRAAESRQILREVGIEPVTDPRNLVVLPQSYHASLHTAAYHNYITERLRPVAGNKAGVEATLASLKAEILARSAAGIRWD